MNDFFLTHDNTTYILTWTNIRVLENDAIQVVAAIHQNDMSTYSMPQESQRDQKDNKNGNDIIFTFEMVCFIASRLISMPVRTKCRLSWCPGAQWIHSILKGITQNAPDRNLGRDGMLHSQHQYNILLLLKWVAMNSWALVISHCKDTVHYTSKR